jgi:hypothetical protein
MSVTQLRRRTDALQKSTGATYLQSITLEEACRRLWRTTNTPAREWPVRATELLRFTSGSSRWRKLSLPAQLQADGRNVADR